MNKHIKKFNDFIKENYSINESHELNYILQHLPNDEKLDISDAKLEYNGELILKLTNDHIETDRDVYDLVDLDEDTLSNLVYEVEQWEIGNEKAYKRAGIDEDDIAWNSSEDDDDFDDEDDDDESILEHIANLIIQGYTSGYAPSWKLETEIFKDGFELGDSDLEHIASQIQIGMTQGDLNISSEHSNETSRGWWKLIR